MAFRSLILAAGLLAASAAFGQSSGQQAAQNAANWDVFQKLYPPRAIKAHEEGAVGFLVTLDSKGDVTKCEITHSSGHPLLDEETCSLVTMHAQFKPDSGVGTSQVRTHQGLIVWKLPNSTTTLGAPQAVVANSAPDKVICKKTAITGSLAGFERTCLTQREWATQSDNAKEMWGDIQGKKGSTHGD